MSNKVGKGNSGPAVSKHVKAKKGKEESKKDSSKKNGKTEASKSNKKTPVKHVVGKTAKDSLKGKEKSKKKDKSGKEKRKLESVAEPSKVVQTEKTPEEIASSLVPEENNAPQPAKDDQILVEQNSEKQSTNENKQSSSVKQSSSGNKPAIKQASSSSKSKEKSKSVQENEKNIKEKESSSGKKTTERKGSSSDSPAGNPALSADYSNKPSVNGSCKPEIKTNAEEETGPDSEVTKNTDDTPQPDQSEKLESTKPTINQMVKNKKTDKPLVTTERIGKAEFESLNDEINELNSGVQMLKHSYGSIIKSLVKMQNTRRAKKRSPQQPAVPGKMNFLTTISALDPKSMKESVLISAEKYAMDNFLNPLTREQTFQQLFAEVDEVNKKTERLRTFFDPRGNFQREKYDASDCHIERAEFNELKLWIKKLITVVDEIARNYNDDLLDLFRLN